MRERWPQWLIVFTAALLWAVSLMLPAVEAGGRSFSGFELLMRGWQGAPRGVYAWFANPLFLAVLIATLLRRRLLAAAGALLAVVFGATSFFVEPLLERSMSSVPEVRLEIGFYVWLAALVVLCLHALTTARLARRRPPPQEHEGQ